MTTRLFATVAIFLVLALPLHATPVYAKEITQDSSADTVTFGFLAYHISVLNEDTVDDCYINYVGGTAVTDNSTTHSTRIPAGKAWSTQETGLSNGVATASLVCEASAPLVIEATGR